MLDSQIHSSSRLPVIIMEPDELVNLVECLASQIEAMKVDSSRPGFEHDIDAAALSSFLASAPRHIDDPKVSSVLTHMQFHYPCCHWPMRFHGPYCLDDCLRAANKATFMHGPADLPLQGHPALVKLQSRLDSEAPVSASPVASRIVSTAAPGEGITCGGMTGATPAEFGPDPSTLRACIEETQREVAAQAALIDWDDASLVGGGLPAVLQSRAWAHTFVLPSTCSPTDQSLGAYPCSDRNMLP